MNSISKGQRLYRLGEMSNFLTFRATGTVLTGKLLVTSVKWE